MNPGFYIRSSLVPTAIFILSKIGVLKTDFADLTDENLYFSMDGKMQKVAYKPEQIAYPEKTNYQYYLLFKVQTSEQRREVVQLLNSQPDLKILVLAHIMYDYSETLTFCQNSFSARRLCVAYDDAINPYLINKKLLQRIANVSDVSDQGWLLFDLSSSKFKDLGFKQRVRFPFFAWVRHLIVMCLSLVFEPIQTFDRAKVHLIKLLYQIRHLSLMSFVRIFYGMKVFFIRSYYAVVHFFKIGLLRIFYSVRHVAVMLAIRLYYGVKSLLAQVQRFFQPTNPLLYPFFKIYWFISFQFKKRILRRNV